MQQSNEKNLISIGSIFLGALVALAFLATLSLLGMALHQSFAPAKEEPISTATMVIGGIFAVLVLVSAFALAGWVASFLSHPVKAVTSLVHSIGAWALLALLFTVLSVAISASVNITLDNMDFPKITTDIKVLDAKAITTISLQEASETKTPEQIQATKLSIIVSWVGFLSVILGLGASVAGGQLCFVGKKNA